MSSELLVLLSLNRDSRQAKCFRHSNVALYGSITVVNPGTPRGTKATIHVIHIDRVVTVQHHNKATDLCLVDLEDSQTITVAQYVARQKYSQKYE